jgi:hypothetical protein
MCDTCPLLPYQIARLSSRGGQCEHTPCKDDLDRAEGPCIKPAAWTYLLAYVDGHYCTQHFKRAGTKSDLSLMTLQEGGIVLRAGPNARCEILKRNGRQCTRAATWIWMAVFSTDLCGKHTAQPKRSHS